MNTMNSEAIYSCLADTLKISEDEVRSFDAQATLADIGLTSLQYVEFVVKIEEMLSIEILDSDLLYENFSTLEQIFMTISRYLDGKNNKKVLILDADNVLWKGTCGEEAIVIDREVVKFQELLIDLYYRGVLLCVCSKNDREIIDATLSDTDMPLKKEHLTMIVANNQDKATNIGHIASALNLNVDSFVFLDDSDYELGFVSLNLGGITCLKADYKLFDFYYKIEEIFAAIHKSDNLNRTQLYHEQKEREKERQHYISVQEYNNSLQTQIDCRTAEHKDCPRLMELSQRTHQFNLSNREYSEEELSMLITNENYVVLLIQVSDKYGDMGVVGFAIVKKCKNISLIESFMLSCRVFGRDFEIFLLNAIKEFCPLPLFGIYNYTKKNHAYKDFYRENGIEQYDQ